MQYFTFPDDGTYLEIEGGSGRKFRFSYAYPGVLKLLQTLTGTGFSGAEGTDYVQLEQYELDGGLGGAGYRLGVRSGLWHIDQVYHPPVVGFDGDEGLDWDAISSHDLESL